MLSKQERRNFVISLGCIDISQRTIIHDSIHISYYEAFSFHRSFMPLKHLRLYPIYLSACGQRCLSAVTCPPSPHQITKDRHERPIPKVDDIPSLIYSPPGDRSFLLKCAVINHELDSCAFIGERCTPSPRPPSVCVRVWRDGTSTITSYQVGFGSTELWRPHSFLAALRIYAA